jgi:hypothetical protein
MDVCKILQEIGTERCVPALYDLLRKNNGQGLDGMAARDTLRRLDPSAAGYRKYLNSLKKGTGKKGLVPR